MSNLSYAIIGTGAIGGYYGACLQRAGNQVHFLLHSDYQHVKENGLIIESPKGNFTLPRVQAYQDARRMPASDVVIVTLKTWTLDKKIVCVLSTQTIFLSKVQSTQSYQRK